MKRIFIAIKVVIGETLSKTVSSLKSGLINESIKWTSLDNIHITLVFIGDTEENMLKVISTTIKESCEGTGKFELTIKGVGVFKNLSDPRVIWTGIEPSDKLAHLNNTIINVLNKSAIEIEQHNFKPHLTLGRIKAVKDKPALKHLIDKFQDVEIQKVPVNEIIIYESILKPTGPLYIPVTIIKL
jgi:2'-5' RNA ligase